jgi:hypothetical protein
VELWELVARTAARDLVDRYAVLADAGRFEELLDLFAPDAVFEAESQRVEGRAALDAYFNRAKARLATETATGLIRHHVTTHRVEVDGPDAASGITYYFAITELGPDHWGRYHDRYVRDPATDRWVFASRVEKMYGTAPGSWAGATDASA